MKWLINLFRRNEHEGVSIGSQITTRLGTGIVTGGSIRIDYGRPVVGVTNSRGKVKYHGTKTDWCHDLKELSE